MPAVTTIQIRRGTAASWSGTNPVLAAGEIGFETDTNNLKFGDGATAYNSLSYFAGSGLSSSLASANLYVGNASNVATSTAITGDVTISNTGVTTIANLAVTTAKLDNLAVTNAKIANSTIDLTAKVTGILPSANGGTANGFFTVSGPTTSAKTFTFPDASATVLTDNTDVTVPQGGTGLSSTTAYAVLCGGTTSTAALQSIAGVGTAGQVLTSNGAGALPTFQAAGGGGGDWTYGSEVSLSGSSVDLITGLPAGVTDFEVLFIGASTAGAGVIVGVQIGDSGGFETSGYTTGSQSFTAAPAVTVATSTSVLGTWYASLTNALYTGIAKFGLEDAATFNWVSAAATVQSTGVNSSVLTGEKSLSAELTQIRLSAAGSSFDAGVAIVRYR